MTEDVPGLQPRVFGTRFWGFDPAANPFVGFTHQGSQAAVIRGYQPGDLIVVLGTTSEPTAEEDRGKLLGLVEFLPTPMVADDLIPEGLSLPERLFENGRFRWPHAVPAQRAWRFTPPEPVRKVIGRQLTRAAITSVDQLSPAEARAVLDLPREEVALPSVPLTTRSARMAKDPSLRLPSGARGQPGPPPSEWSAMVSREDGPTATYLMRFGHLDCWKIGISQNHSDRERALNFAIPSEVLQGAKWALFLHKVWPSGARAYEMEQALLKRLEAYARPNERIQATEAIISSAWYDYLQGRY